MEENIKDTIIVAIGIAIFIGAFLGIYKLAKSVRNAPPCQKKIVVSVEPISVNGFFGGSIQYIQKFDDGSFLTTEGYTHPIGYSACI
jgi:hypothetical protein